MPTQHLPSEIEQFNEEVQLLLEQKNCHTHSLLSFIRRSLYQFHLEGSYDVTEVLIQAYIRGVKTIQNGTPILKPTPWLRATAFNIIREASRQRQKLVSYGEITEYHLMKSNATDGYMPDLWQDLEEGTSEAIAAVRAAFVSLSPEERLLLRLRYIEGLSWDDVSHSLSQFGKLSCKPASLRKRGQRVLDKLRDKYQKSIQTSHQLP